MNGKEGCRKPNYTKWLTPGDTVRTVDSLTPGTVTVVEYARDSLGKACRVSHFTVLFQGNVAVNFDGADLNEVVLIREASVLQYRQPKPN